MRLEGGGSLRRLEQKQLTIALLYYSVRMICGSLIKFYGPWKKQIILSSILGKYITNDESFQLAGGAPRLYIIKLIEKCTEHYLSNINRQNSEPLTLQESS